MLFFDSFFTHNGRLAFECVCVTPCKSVGGIVQQTIDEVLSVCVWERNACEVEKKSTKHRNVCVDSEKDFKSLEQF